MRSLIFAGFFLSASAAAGLAEEVVRSVSIQNSTRSSIVVWVNGEKKEIGYNSAILAPCLPGEKVEVQVGNSLERFPCGSTVEIKV